MRRVAQLFTITALTALSIAAFAKVVPERGCPFKNGEPVEQNGEPQPQRDVRLVASVL